MIDKDAYKKLRDELWEYVGDAAQCSNPDKEAAFLRALLLVELAAGNIKAE